MRKEGGAMKRLLLLGAGSALMFSMGGVGPAAADNGPHVSTAGTASTQYNIGIATGAGRCATCHRAHTAKAALLLKEAQPALCYSCHGGGAGANTDVQNGTSGSGGAALRGGGFEFALIGAGEAVKTLGLLDTSTGRIAHSAVVPVGASEATTSSHQINGTATGTMWGNGAISATPANPGKSLVTLECGSCHDPHGNGNYRILKPIPSGSDNGIMLTPAVVAVAEVSHIDPVTGLKVIDTAAVKAVKAVNGPVAVNIPDAPSGLVTDSVAVRAAARAASHIYTTDNYWDVRDTHVAGVAVAGTTTLTDGYIANASQWCSTCHTRYLAKAPDYETNSTDAIFAYRHTSGRVDSGGVERPNCIQCHVSHGSNAAMAGSAAAVPFPGQVGSSTSVAGDLASTQAGYGDSKLLRIDNRGVCVACHNV